MMVKRKIFRPRRPRRNTAKAEDELFRAKDIARELQKVLDDSGPRKAAMERAASRLGISSRQLYTHLKRYKNDRTTSSLLRKDGPRARRLPDEVEKIIETNLRVRWLIKEEPDLAPVAGEIAAQCEEAGFTPPSYGAVQDRIALLFTPEEIAKKRSSNPNDVRRLKPRPGQITASAPLIVTQMDHTPTDINFVEVVDDTGAFVGRASLTINTDVFSKCILGFCLTIEKPSTLSIALCMAHSICDKGEWLSSRGIRRSWITYGRPKRALVDSGADFKGHAFARGCAEYNIRPKRRNRGTVHWGGVVERLLGKLNRYVGKYDGRTGSSVADRNGYSAENRACLTFNDLERCIALAIIDHNEDMNKKTLKVPIKEWIAHAPDPPKKADEPHKVLLNFLPGKTRKLFQQGIRMFAREYYSPWLGTLIADRDKIGLLEVRWDPRDISRIYARDPHSGEFRPVERRDGNKDAITLWQDQAQRRRMRAENARTPAQKVAIPREIEAIVSKARKNKPPISKMSKSEARAIVRARHATHASKPYQSMDPPEPAPAPHPIRSKRILPLDEW